MWNWGKDSSNHGGKTKSHNKKAWTLQGKDNSRFWILCFNIVKGLARITKICLASLGVWKNILKSLGLGVSSLPEALGHQPPDHLSSLSSLRSLPKFSSSCAPKNFFFRVSAIHARWLTSFGRTVDKLDNETKGNDCLWESRTLSAKSRLRSGWVGKRLFYFVGVSLKSKE